MVSPGFPGKSRTKGLRMYCARRVDAGPVFVRALEPDAFRCEVGAYPLKESLERNAAPFSDRAPTFYADMAGDLRRLRQGSPSGCAPREARAHQWKGSASGRDAALCVPVEGGTGLVRDRVVVLWGFSTAFQPLELALGQPAREHGFDRAFDGESDADVDEEETR